MPKTQAPARKATHKAARNLQQAPLFCSYAHGDDNVVQAFTRAFQALNDVVSHNIAPFSDQAIGPASPATSEMTLANWIFNSVSVSFPKIRSH